MGVEIERKFLLKNEDWRSEVRSKTTIKQGYLNSEKERTVRIRVRNDKGYLTVKGENKNATRQEFEYEIPVTSTQVSSRTPIRNLNRIAYKFLLNILSLVLIGLHSVVL